MKTIQFDNVEARRRLDLITGRNPGAVAVMTAADRIYGGAIRPALIDAAEGRLGKDASKFAATLPSDWSYGYCARNALVASDEQASLLARVEAAEWVKTLIRRVTEGSATWQIDVGAIALDDSGRIFARRGSLLANAPWREATA